MSYLLSIGTANPAHQHLQTDVAHFYTNAAIGDTTAQRKIWVVAKKSGIDKRYSVLKDFSLVADEFEFFPPNASLLPSPLLSQRMAVFQSQALALSLAAIKNIPNFATAKSAITHLITVTCTGLFAPGLDIELIEALALSPKTQRSSINFMGCNAALLALKQAHQICGSEENALVLIVCTELCTLHFQSDFSDDYILSNLLFGDGSAAVLVASKPNAVPTELPVLRLKSFYSLVITEGKKEMAWRLAETGFMMNLTAYVSPLLNKYMPELLREVGVEAAQTNTYWVLHPGGKRILDDFCKNLGLNTTQLASAYHTLKEYGNMSSPTILFVLKQLLATTHLPTNATLFMAGFGPGLNIETARLEYV